MKEHQLMYLRNQFTCYVYWIHLDSHLSWKDGYIGVSIDPDRRFNEHQNPKQKFKLHEEIEKYKDHIRYDIIYCGLEKSCYSIEKELRPTSYVGWNESAGGIGGTSSLLKGIKKSYPAHNKGKPMSDDQKAKLRAIMLGRPSPNRGRKIGPSPKKGKPGIPHSKETKEKMRQAMLGKTCSAQTREKIRQSKLGKPNLGYLRSTVS